MNFSDLNSVEEFLRKTDAARQSKRDAVEDGLRAYIEDPSTIGVTPELGETIQGLVESYGDEVFRQLAIFCIGKWLDVHAEIAKDHCKTDSIPELIATTSDATRLGVVMQTLEQVSSFSGDQHWRKMLCSHVAETIIDDFEERGLDPMTVFKNIKDKQ